MKSQLKFLLSAFLISLPFWWGMNVFAGNLENFLFWNSVNGNPEILAAQLTVQTQLKNLKPVRQKGAEDFEVKAEAAISLFVGNDGGEKILFQKEIEKKLPIASLTKLMTASVVLKNYDLSRDIKSKNGDEFFPVEYYLYPLLIKSDNDAAFALTNNYDGMTEQKFVGLMNEEAKKMNLTNTFFANSSGLDPDDLKQPADRINFSTAEDLARMTKLLLSESSVWNIMSIQKFDLFGPELSNTNELLGEIPSIVGGKTGYTERARGCMVLVLKAPKGKGYIINVILGAEGPNSRFEEMKNLTTWLNSAYRW